MPAAPCRAGRRGSAPRRWADVVRGRTVAPGSNAGRAAVEGIDHLGGAAGAAGVLEIRGTVGEQARRLEARRHVGQHELDRLQLGDRAAEGGALLRVGERVLERGAADAEAPGGDAGAAAGEQAERLLEALVLLADEILRRHAHVLEDDLRRVARAQPELLDLAPVPEPGCALLHHEGRDAALSLLGRGRGHHHVDVSDRPLRDEHLGAVQHPRVAVAYGARAQRRRVAPGAGLGEAPGAQPLPAGHARQLAAAERVAPEHVDVARGEAGVGGDRQAERGVVAREPLDDEQVGERVGAAAAHVLGQRDAHEAERAEALHGLVREALLAVPRGGVRLHLALAEVADRLLDVAVLAGKREVHHAARGRMLARIQSTISCVEAPGVKTLATPARARAGMSSSGMMPPPKTSLSPPPRWRSSSTTAGKSVRWAPERIESPTASTSSWIAASATISGVWWRPV